MSTPLENFAQKATPARVIQRFLSTLVGLLLAALLIGQLKLPYYGATAWDLGGNVLEWLFLRIPVAAEAVAAQYPFVTGTVGVLWLTTNYLRIHRTGQRTASVGDACFAGLALILFVIYYAFPDLTLPVTASFFYRLSLYCAISVVVFGVSVLFGHVDVWLEKQAKELSEVFILVALFVLLFSGLATSVPDITNNALIGFKVVNVALHLGANFGAFAMAALYQGAVARQTIQKA